MTSPTLPWRAATLALLALLAAPGCSERSGADRPAAAAPNPAPANPPSTTVLGVAPGGPTADPPATTSAAKSDVSSAQESVAMPMPGQANDHSAPTPGASRAGAGSGR